MNVNKISVISAPEVAGSTTATVENDLDSSDYYQMNHTSRGTAVILNHLEFDKLYKRNGTIKDAQDLKQVLSKLNFDVKIYNDLKYEAIYDLIVNLSKADYSDTDCFLIIVLSHGKSGKIHARDREYPCSFLWLSFSEEKCPSLTGKPKLFFIQAFQGKSIDSGVSIRPKSVYDGICNNTTIPATPDILVMYSCYDRFASWRDPLMGSWLIQSLCEEIKLRAPNADILTILTFVNRRMAIEYESYNPKNETLHNKKQIGTIYSTLTRLLCFY